MSNDWIECTEEGWELSFRRPPTDGSGRALLVERRSRGTEAVHVMAEDRDEIYFEVTRWVGWSADHLYAEMQGRLPEMYPGIEFDDLSASEVGRSGSFRWPGQVRDIHFLELGETTYRIILRPVGPTNLEMLATIEIAGRQ